ncbi:hypothetical protein ADICYQ_0887 [Cyclobacterium qasimii M12-11B]|uniref:Uncharacterized protein n=1 Tax=Cyclobacterium qasimii M12-11B TaxID=641524 RepID=S7VLS9_9BACT|nr:hypothetical protein ADICYQ_0887 [Cyclobacterium qasimii M12-11B]
MGCFYHLPPREEYQAYILEIFRPMQADKQFQTDLINLKLSIWEWEVQLKTA